MKIGNKKYLGQIWKLDLKVHRFFGGEKGCPIRMIGLIIYHQSIRIVELNSRLWRAITIFRPSSGLTSDDKLEMSAEHVVWRRNILVNSDGEMTHYIVSHIIIIIIICRWNVSCCFKCAMFSNYLLQCSCKRPSIVGLADSWRHFINNFIINFLCQTPTDHWILKWEG